MMLFRSSPPVRRRELSRVTATREVFFRLFDTCQSRAPSRRPPRLVSGSHPAPRFHGNERGVSPGEIAGERQVERGDFFPSALGRLSVVRVIPLAALVRGLAQKRGRSVLARCKAHAARLHLAPARPDV